MVVLTVALDVARWGDAENCRTWSAIYLKRINSRGLAPESSIIYSSVAIDGKPVSKIFPLRGFELSPGNRIDLDIKIPEHAGDKIWAVEDRFTRRPFQLASIKVKQSKPVDTPNFTPPIEANFIPANIFETVKVEKTWDLSAIRGGKFGIGWTMNQKLWSDAGKVNFQSVLTKDL